ncbi:MAG: Na/Pi cotransporter family protein, partial [Clostridia bacterium]|nr:Na/Pi cotransporter family protein [Clostridia bacterium]
IALIHSAFNLSCTVLMLPAASLLEKLVCKIIPDRKQPEHSTTLDERLLATPSVALGQCRDRTVTMAKTAVDGMKNALSCLSDPNPEVLRKIREAEEETDLYEDTIGTFLVKLNANKISDRDGAESAKILKIIGDLERLGDHAKNLADSAEECVRNKIAFSPSAEEELRHLTDAVEEILSLTLRALENNDQETAAAVEPLEQVIDRLKDRLRNNHILRLRQGECGLETGFVWSDILTDLERAADHCSNIAGCVEEEAELNLHADLRRQQTRNPAFDALYHQFAEKYL